jgi:Ca-activated chloride channel homolog
VSRSLLAVALAVLLAQAAFAGLGDSAPSKNRAGNKLYDQSKYDEALAQYRAAQVIAPELMQLSFNAGDALFQKGDLENAIREFGKAAASADTALSADASYNAGNAFLKMGQPEQAIGAYTQALKRDPSHADAKHNLELALRLLEQQQQQQQNQQDQQKQQDQQSQQGQQGQQNQQDQQKQQDQQDQQKQQGQQEQQKQQDQQEQQDQQGQQGAQQETGMSKEDAERLLDAVGEQEREIQAERRAAQARKRSKVDKDW